MDCVNSPVTDRVRRRERHSSAIFVAFTYRKYRDPGIGLQVIITRLGVTSAYNDQNGLCRETKTWVWKIIGNKTYYCFIASHRQGRQGACCFCGVGRAALDRSGINAQHKTLVSPSPSQVGRLALVYNTSPNLTVYMSRCDR